MFKYASVFHLCLCALSFRSWHPYISRRFPSSLQSAAYGPLHPTNCNLFACSVERHSSTLNECMTSQQFSLLLLPEVLHGDICWFDQQCHATVSVSEKAVRPPLRFYVAPFKQHKCLMFIYTPSCCPKPGWPHMIHILYIFGNVVVSVR